MLLNWMNNYYKNMNEFQKHDLSNINQAQNSIYSIIPII
jgi:hypothetical protein